MQMYEIRNASKSKNVQISHRLRILLLIGIFSGVRKPFCLQSISNNAGEALFVKYVVCIGVICLEVVGPNL